MNKSQLKYSNDTPLISVIIPVYNTPEVYLRKCFESVINQTYKNLEIIIIDDNSTDRSGEIADEYARNDKRITVIHQKSNTFQYQARNNGISVANGEWIHFVDCDDWVHEDTYQTLLMKLKPKTEAILFGGKAIFESKENENNPKYNYYKTAYNKSDFTGLAIDYFVNMYNHSPAPWIIMFKRSLFTEDTKFYLDIINEDEVFMPRFLLRCGRVQSISDTLIFHLIREGQVTRKKNTFNNARSYWVVAKELSKELNNGYSARINYKLKDLINSFYDSVKYIYANELDIEERKRKVELPYSDQVEYEHIIEDYISMQERIAIIERDNVRLADELKGKTNELESHMSVKRSIRLTAGNIKRRIKKYPPLK